MSEEPCDKSEHYSSYEHIVIHIHKVWIVQISLGPAILHIPKV